MPVATINAGIQDFRLTLTSGLPVTIADVVGAGTIYFTPYKGPRIALHDGVDDWNVYSSAEISIALAALTKGVIYDLFCYPNAGVPALSAVAWESTVSTSSPAADPDNPVVFNVPFTPAALANGDVVVISDGAAQQLARVTAHADNVSITVERTYTAFALPTIGFPYRMAAGMRVRQDGILCKTAATQYRYVGTFLTTAGGGAGTTEDSLLRRFLYNADNRALRPMFVENFTSHDYTTAMYRPWNKDQPNSQVQFVLGLVDDQVVTRSGHLFRNTNVGVSAYCGAAFDTVLSNDHRPLFADSKVANMTECKTTFGVTVVQKVGAHFCVSVEYSTAVGTMTWPYTGVTGEVWA